MKKVILSSVLSMIAIFVLMSFSSPNATSDFLGKWTYTATDAPYEYSKGEIFVSKDKAGKYQCSITFNDYSKTTVLAKNVKVNNTKLSFSITVDYEDVNAVLTLKDKKLKGMVSYPEGSISVLAYRKK